MSYLYQWSQPSSILQNQQKFSPYLQKQLSSKIEQISCGEQHFFILTTSNQLIGFGSTNKGQLGIQQTQHNSYEQGIIPKLTLKSSIKQISCGWNHTLILDQCGTIYSCGEGKNGALGYGRGNNSQLFKQISFSCLNNSSYKRPQFNEGNNKIVQISAGRDHSLALSENKVYGWGSSKDHQLGLVKQKIYYEPQELYIFHSYFCYAGDRCSFFGTKQGLYASGNNQGGKLGLGHEKKIKIPKRMNFQHRVKEIQDGGYVLIQTVIHEFYLSGKGNLGQYLYPTKVKHLQQFSNVALGKDFGILKSNDNYISTWNFRNQPNPVGNKILSSSNVQMFICGPRSIIGFSNQLRSKPISKNLMAKSTISNNQYQQTKNNGLNYQPNIHTQKRKQSDNLNVCFKSSYFQDRQNQVDCQSNDPTINALRLNKLINQSMHRTKRSQNYEKSDKKLLQINSQSQQLQNIEENAMVVDQSGQMQTPIFIRNHQQGLNAKDINLEEAEEQDDSGESLVVLKQPIQPLSDSRQSTSQLRNSHFKYTSLPNHANLSQNRDHKYCDYLEGRVQNLQAQNRRKDIQMMELKNSYSELFHIFQSDLAMKRILQTKHPNYLDRYHGSFNLSENKRPINQFDEHIAKLKSILVSQYSTNK